MDPSTWLSDEDTACFEDRLSGLQWLAENSPKGEIWAFPGGLVAKSLFEETRYSFVYGQFLAANLLGLAYIERTLSALFYGAGRNDLTDAGLAILLKEALTENLITASELEDLERIRKQRNSYAHFRKPGHKDSIERRSLEADQAPYDVIEKDAIDVVKSVLHMVDKGSL